MKQRRPCRTELCMRAGRSERASLPPMSIT